MFRSLLKNRDGNFSVMMVVATIPILGGMALAVDYTNMSRQKSILLNAMDAAGIATGRRIQEGGTDAEIIAYAQEFFKANLNGISPDKAVLTVTLPTAEAGGGTLKLQANLKYDPYFLGAFQSLIGTQSSTNLDFNEVTEIRLKNTLEVALVLDNSGSMTEIGTGSGKTRMELLKDAAKQLVDTMAAQGAALKQVDKAVQFGLVPFAGSVNVGPGYANASWMDTTGISPIHHENFDWSVMTQAANANRYAQKVGNVWYARGNLWGTYKDKPLTRFAMYDLMQRVTAVSPLTYGQLASWAGCVEARPAPYNLNDTAPTTGTPETLFVPMFAPDETNQTDSSSRPANNNWLPDVSTSSSALTRQKFMPKYFTTGTSVTSAHGMDSGPNTGCSTAAIKALTDVTTTAGKDEVKAAIDTMVPDGATNVPEGLAWGWRVVSSGAPFTEGRGDTEKGNDKVVIVLTDGANTYYGPTTVVAQAYSGTYYNYGGNDLAGNKSIYSAYGYTGVAYQGGDTRIFKDTSSNVSKSDFSNANYTKAMNEQFATLCANAKAKNLVIMTVSLDLNSNNTTQKAQMDALKACSSDSRYRKDPTDATKPAKLYWNSTGGNLSTTFKEIADELSNLRIVG